MKIMVVGGGGREHALVWKLSQSPRVKKIYCAPGNAGIAKIAECVDISIDDISALGRFARQKGIHYTLVGPEAPLADGIVNYFEAAGLKIFGPSEQAAELESSKVFAKRIMDKYDIPTAKYKVFTDSELAIKYVRKIGIPCVIKAEGLAAGKGVIVAHDEQTAIDAIKAMLIDRVFGYAGERIIVEECLVGEEVSMIAFTDGKTVLPMLPAQDHKAINDNDTGPNTGGMGAYCPAPICPPELQEKVLKEILIPTIKGMETENRPFKGVIYAGLMITSEGPKVLEFNVRFGDPEAQPQIMMLDTDLIDIVEAVINESLDKITLKWKDGASVCVVMASGGYPGDYKKGIPISGLENVPSGVQVFHAGTALKDGRIVTAGGRVLGITSVGKNVFSAIENAYSAVSAISFDGMHYRTDIGKKALT